MYGVRVIGPVHGQGFHVMVDCNIRGFPESDFIAGRSAAASGEQIDIRLILKRKMGQGVKARVHACGVEKHHVTSVFR
jgi:hypothetical protein